MARTAICRSHPPGGALAVPPAAAGRFCARRKTGVVAAVDAASVGAASVPRCCACAQHGSALQSGSTAPALHSAVHAYRSPRFSQCEWPFRAVRRRCQCGSRTPCRDAVLAPSMARRYKAGARLPHSIMQCMRTVHRASRNVDGPSGPSAAAASVGAALRAAMPCLRPAWLGATKREHGSRTP